METASSQILCIITRSLLFLVPKLIIRLHISFTKKEYNKQYEIYLYRTRHNGWVKTVQLLFY